MSVTKFPLLNRTHYSLLRGFTKPDELVKACKASGFTSVGLCDLGSVSGAVEFLEACRASKMRGIIGCDFNGTRVFAKNLNGWKELIKIVTEWNCDDCLNQVRLGSSSLAVVDGQLNDCRYIEASDEISYRVLRSIDLKITLSKIEEDTGGFHLPAEDEILDNKIYSDLAEAESYDITGPPRLPQFECPDGLDEITFLWQKVEAGLLSILPSLSVDEVNIYRDRVTYEMKVIELADLAGYFLIVADFVGKARKDNQLASIGRGCFLPDTRVKTPNGLYRSIAFIEIGDSVIDAYGNTQTVYDTLEYSIDEEMIEVEFLNGKVIRCTKDHKFLTANRGWVEAEKISDDDDIIEV